MRSSKAQFVLGFFTAIIVIVTVLYFGLVPGFSSETYLGPTPVAEALSADGQYVARRERKSNNDDWCEERTTIDRVAGNRSDWEREYVFMNTCDMPVEMQWIDNRSIRISYGFDPQGIVHVSREALSKDKQIKISYELNEEASQ
jgi:hypothetical protein